MAGPFESHVGLSLDHQASGDPQIGIRSQTLSPVPWECSRGGDEGSHGRCWPSLLDLVHLPFTITNICSPVDRGELIHRSWGFWVSLLKKLVLLREALVFISKTQRERERESVCALILISRNLDLAGIETSGFLKKLTLK